MHYDATSHMNKPIMFWLTVYQVSALPGLFHVIALTEKGVTVELNRHKRVPTIQKSHKEILTAEQRTFASGPILN
jgi:hypothetical protein